MQPDYYPKKEIRSVTGVGPENKQRLNLTWQATLKWSKEDLYMKLYISIHGA